MKTKKIIGLLFQLPLILLVLASFFASIYAVMNNISEITYYSSILLGTVIVLYFVGRYLQW